MKSAAPVWGATAGADEDKKAPASNSTCPLAPQPDLPELRRIWWRIIASGDRLPPEIGVIVIEGGR